PEHENDQRDHGEDLAPVEVFEFVMMCDLTGRSEENLLEHVKDINRRHNNAEGGESGIPGVADGFRAKRTKQDGELTHEAVETGQTHRRERSDEHERTKDRRDLPQTAVDFDLASVRLFVDHTDEKEQRASAQTMVDHLQDRARDAFSVEREETEHDETKVAHRGISDQFLYVCLGVGNS